MYKCKYLFNFTSSNNNKMYDIFKAEIELPRHLSTRATMLAKVSYQPAGFGLGSVVKVEYQGRDITKWIDADMNNALSIECEELYLAEQEYMFWQGLE